VACTAALLAKRPELVRRLLTVVLDPPNISMTSYLATSLACGLFLLYDLSREPGEQRLRLGLTLDNLTHRKLFHVLALVIYTPMHAKVLTERTSFEFLVLAQNLVTVLMIYIELIRFANLNNAIGDSLTRAFSRFADEREQAEKRLLLTHLYLLVGLGMATNLTFILLNGGFPDGEMTIFAYSGVAFLGVLDTFAALMGKNFGTSFWRKAAHSKT